MGNCFWLVCVAAFASLAPPPAQAQTCAELPRPPLPNPRSRPYGEALEQWRQILKSSPAEVILMGDSLLAGWSDDELRRVLGDRFVNFSAGGDRTDNLLWRIHNIVPDEAGFQKVIVLIGTNDLSARRPACEIVAGAFEIVRQVLARSPKAHVYLLTLLPRGQRLTSFEQPIAQINASFRQYQSDRVTILDVHALFKQACPGQECHLLRKDNLHITGEGYAVLGDYLKTALTK